MKKPLIKIKLTKTREKNEKKLFEYLKNVDKLGDTGNKDSGTKS